ncbi:hypothetical protein BTHE68_58540 (plasmid) [Burkholderia sp. THE68]|uniref:hypothetical protein n=1 Tax=Burkholderia sp. THE68 TaxID=758782 RepID=UPI001319B0C7|nr:hypothetical protein [Burkholderia sp. THE68]BBU32120.1 hypothetical protein BTHE68_58540 [Burkholderia sp. THE68]
MLRTDVGKGPLELLDPRGFTMPSRIFVKRDTLARNAKADIPPPLPKPAIEAAKQVETVAQWSEYATSPFGHEPVPLACTPRMREDTPFDDLKVGTPLLSFARLLLQGGGNDFERDLGMRRYWSVGWRRGLEDVIHARWPLLRFWNDWQRERRYRAARRKARPDDSMAIEPALIALPSLANRSSPRPR